MEEKQKTNKHNKYFMYFFNVFKLSKITRNAVTEKLNRSRISNRRKSKERRRSM